MLLIQVLDIFDQTKQCRIDNYLAMGHRHPTLHIVTMTVYNQLQINLQVKSWNIYGGVKVKPHVLQVQVKFVSID